MNSFLTIKYNRFIVFLLYRLVAQHTIEEKIVELHHNKRDLAESLLEGSEMSGKVSAAELLRLISE